MSDVPRWRRPILVLTSFLLIPFGLGRSTAFAQQSPSSPAQSSALPDAPQPQTASATISGTVLDMNRDVLQGAEITLIGPSGSAIANAQSGNDGQFVFLGLPPNAYTLRVSAQGMSDFTSSQIDLHAAETRIVPISLSVSGGRTIVTVSGNKEELAEEQVHIAEQQRIAGIIPNFYSSYDWNAPPMEAKQKIQLGIRSVVDPVSFLSIAGLAGAEQYRNIFPAYGGGFEGYGKRYGAALANHVSATLLGRAVYPSIFHQDPRYFYKGTGSIQSRIFYAVSAAVMARSDSGRWQPNYSRVLGNFSAAAISNLYYPAADRGGSLVLFNGLANTGADAVANLLREFVLKKITSRAPEGSVGKP